MIDVNNMCGHDCTYCVKHVRHLRDDQRFQISVDEFEKCLDSLCGWPNKIALTGGDPLTHPEFETLCSLVSRYVPKDKALIFTSHKKLHAKYKPLIDATFGEVYVNYHDESQRSVCLHQPMLLAVGDMVKDEAARDQLIRHCWCNQMWSPIVGKHGAFFCDCALGLDVALDMGGGWPVERDWWKRDWDEYQDQVKQYCSLCGMCLPYPQQTISDRVEKISIGLFQRFVENGLRKLTNMNVIIEPLTTEQVLANMDGWEPWHNRQDRDTAEGPEYVNPC